MNEITNQSNKEMQRVVANERAAADKRVCEQAAAFARRQRSVCATGSASQARQTLIALSCLSSCSENLDEMAGIYAAEADRARSAGVVCEKAYDAVKDE